MVLSNCRLTATSVPRPTSWAVACFKLLNGGRLYILPVSQKCLFVKKNSVSQCHNLISTKQHPPTRIAWLRHWLQNILYRARVDSKVRVNDRARAHARGLVTVEPTLCSAGYCDTHLQMYASVTSIAALRTVRKTKENSIFYHGSLRSGYC